MKRALIAIGLAAAAVAILLKRPPPEPMLGRAMGCEWKLQVGERIDADSVRAEIVNELEKWEQVLSTWRQDSDLSRHNRGEPASPELARVLELAEELHTQSGGAFDHRMLGALTRAGFGPGGEGIDLSSIGKGWAVDRVAERLAARGLRRYAFSLAGEVRTGEGEWPVAIENPDPLVGGIAETLPLSGLALATSGNYRQWRRAAGGKLASHLLDPATGEPVLRPPSSVTVIGPSAARASGWATALFVIGPKGDPLAMARGMWVIRHGDAGP